MTAKPTTDQPPARFEIVEGCADWVDGKIGVVYAVRTFTGAPTEIYVGLESGRHLNLSLHDFHQMFRRLER